MDIYDEGSFHELIGTELEDEVIKHYGTPRHSGRYPWGSGENPYQHEDNWLSEYRNYKSQGMSETEIAKKFGISTTVLRDKRKASEEADLIARSSYVKRMILKGYTPTSLSRLTGWNESTIRGLRDYVVKEKASRSRGTADMLIREFNKKGWLDVGKGVDKAIGVSESTLKAALQILKDEGYNTVNIVVEQANNPGHYTTLKVLCKDGTTRRDIFKNIDKINTVVDYSEDAGKTFVKPRKPTSVDSSRIYIRYGEEGGSQRDGTIELRPGVADLSLGKNHYAQVRIAVDDKMYMKGMAFYSDDIPEGFDIVYNSNKPKGTVLYDGVYKPLKENKKTGEVDWDNPFGAVIRKENGQRDYVDENGETKLSPINIIKQEGDWDSYSKSLSSQFLSKQKKDFVKKQLKLTLAEKQDEYNDILSIENPTIRSKFLKDFAESCDSDAVELKATAVPGQTSKVILPVNSLKDNEVYAPGYSNGDVLCLVRYPHGGVFEIPTLTVNNKNKEAKKMLGNSLDAIGININVAGVLSGADFDGDSVIVIPQSDKIQTLTKKPYKELEGWSEKMAILYPAYEGMKIMTDREKGLEMGKISNLITDMTIQGAPDDKIVRAVKQSMVVIDAKKHKYNYKQSEQDLGIDALRKEYQSKSKSGSGASTLISMASSKVRVPQRAIGYDINPKTGEKIYRETKKTYFKPVRDKDGNIIDWKEHYYEQESTKMAETNDAFTLSSGTIVENAYATYANSLKIMANDARKKAKAIDVSVEKVDPDAKKEYKEEITSLKAKVANAEANAPRERYAQIITSAYIREKLQESPELKAKENKKDLTKLTQIALADARAKVHASKKDVYVQLNEKEKEAINKGAVSATLLNSIMKNMNKDDLREFVMPSTETKISDSRISLMKGLSESGWTLQQIAQRFGYSPSTVGRYVNDIKD